MAFCVELVGGSGAPFVFGGVRAVVRGVVAVLALALLVVGRVWSLLVEMGVVGVV